MTTKLSVEIRGNVRDAAGVDRLLRSLPDWFGIESALVDYVEQAAVLPSYAAIVAGEMVGICLVKHHSTNAAEIYLLAVEPKWHRRGIGTALHAAVEEDLIANGIEFLQVKTLGASCPSPEYELTRRFYEAMGFSQLEEIHGLWPDNPCSIMIKHLPSSGRTS
jgi:ribosomal protein S18 acetylase RimI-like enzyme